MPEILTGLLDKDIAGKTEELLIPIFALSKEISRVLTFRVLDQWGRHFQIRSIRGGLFLLTALAVTGDGGQLVSSGFGRYRDSDSSADRGSLPRSNPQKFGGRVLCYCPSRWHLQVHSNMFGWPVRWITDRGLPFERLSANRDLVVRRQPNGQEPAVPLAVQAAVVQRAVDHQASRSTEPPQ